MPPPQQAPHRQKRNRQATLLWTTTALLLLTMSAIALLALANSDQRVLVVGSHGPTSLRKLAYFVGASCFTAAACGWAWHFPKASSPALATVARAAAVLLSVVLLLGCVGYAWLTAIGGTTRYINVGSTHGQTITVAEYSSLGGTTLELGTRDGWYFTPSSQPSAWANSNQVPPGPPPSQKDTYKLHTSGHQVSVSYKGEHPLRMTLVPRTPSGSR